MHNAKNTGWHSQYAEGTHGSYIYGLHLSMNYLSLLLLGPWLCFIIYLVMHKVYCIYKYTAGLRNGPQWGKTVQQPLAHWCHHTTVIDSLTTEQVTVKGKDWLHIVNCRSRRWARNKLENRDVWSGTVWWFKLACFSFCQGKLQRFLKWTGKPMGCKIL